MDLVTYGWSPQWQTAFDRINTEYPTTQPARIVRQVHHHYRVVMANGEHDGQVTGRFRHEASAPDAFPAVGDWVAAEPIANEERVLIHVVLPRNGAFVRRAAGNETVAQVAAANVDTALIVMGLDDDYNPRRLERYLTLTWESGASPVIVLNKRDLCTDTALRVDEVSWAAAGAPVIAVSALTDETVDGVGDLLQPGATAVVLGSSGAGKSTLVNRLYGAEVLRTGAVREDDSRGRHTTTHRELLRLPSGALIIDTPGMRELQLWANDASVDRTFSDIASLAESCRFRDCTHDREPGCAVQDALQSGALDEGRFASYQKLLREQHYIARQKDQRLQREEKQKWKAIHKMQKEIYKHRP